MTRKSQARASEKPPPAATPSTAAITGFGIWRISSTAWWKRPASSRKAAGGPSGCPAAHLRSPPAQNAPPAPASTTARTRSAAATVASCRARRAAMSRSNALSPCGRSSRTFATGPSSVTATVSGTVRASFGRRYLQASSHPEGADRHGRQAVRVVRGPDRQDRDPGGPGRRRLRPDRGGRPQRRGGGGRGLPRLLRGEGDAGRGAGVARRLREHTDKPVRYLV